MSDQNNGATRDSGWREKGRRRLGLRVVGYTLLLLALLLAVYGAVAFSAWERGKALVSESEQQALEDELLRQFERAQQDAAEGNVPLAIRRLDWILAQREEFPGAEELFDRLQQPEIIESTPEPLPTLTPLPTSDDRSNNQARDKELDEIEKLVEEELWEDALTAILRFEANYPNYNRLATDQLLFRSYIRLGEDLVNDGQLELGLYYFSQAEKLGDLPIEIEDQRIWSELYLLGISYYGVDWGTTIYYLRDLCSAAPYFQESCSIYYNALIAYGDQYAAALDWCPAQELYREALAIRSSQELRETIEQSAISCADATPTATATQETEFPLDEFPTLPSD